MAPIPWCTSCPERQTPTLRQGSAPNLFQAPPRSSAMRNSTPRGHSFRFPVLVPQSSNDGNELDTLCAGTSRLGSGSAWPSVRGVCGHRSGSQQPEHGRVDPARQRAGRMAPRRLGAGDHPGAASGNDGRGHGDDTFHCGMRTTPPADGAPSGFSWGPTIRQRVDSTRRANSPSRRGSRFQILRLPAACGR